jgi:hypothetical protein
MSIKKEIKMKRIFFVLFVGALIFAGGIGVIIVLQAAAAQVSTWLHAATAAVNAYPSAAVGRLLGDVIVAKWNIEVAKLLFWIHLVRGN